MDFQVLNLYSFDVYIIVFLVLQMYKPDKGVTLRESGLCFIRAMAVKEGFINSDIFTSR